MVIAHQESDAVITVEDINRVNQLISEVLLEEAHQSFLDTYVRWKQAVAGVLELEELALETPNGSDVRLSVVAHAHKVLAISAKLRVGLAGLSEVEKSALAVFGITVESIKSYNTSLAHTVNVLETASPQEIAEVEALRERIFSGQA